MVAGAGAQVPHPLYRPTKSKLVPCVHRLCASLHNGLTGKHRCDSPHEQCDYVIKYADQGSSTGVLINDSFALRLTNGSVARPSVAFGYTSTTPVRLISCTAFAKLAIRFFNCFCFLFLFLCRCGYDQQVRSGDLSWPTDGVLGLGTGSVSLLSQLKQRGVTKNVVGHCLSLRGGGFLFFGDDLVPYQRATWTPMARSAFR